MTERDLDARLSAWIDGEASEEEARALGERVANDPEVAARFAALSRVDERLRELPVPAPPADLRERLAERVAAREDPVVVPLRPRPLRWAVPAAAALAAGIAIYLGVRTTPEVVPGAPVAPEPPIARDETDLKPGETPLSSPDAASRLAERPAAGSEPAARSELAAGSELEPEAAELALAFDYDALRDFDVIDQLELLEVLAAYEEERGRAIVKRIAAIALVLATALAVPVVAAADPADERRALRERWRDASPAERAEMRREVREDRRDSMRERRASRRLDAAERRRLRAMAARRQVRRELRAMPEAERRAVIENVQSLPESERRALKRKMATLSPAERSELLGRVRALRSLDDAERAELFARRNDLERRSESERQRFEENAERWRAMAPDERERMRRQLERLRAMSPDERLELLDRALGEEPSR